MITPFAYQLICYCYDSIDDNKAFPNPRAACEYITKRYPPNENQLVLTAFYPDGSDGVKIDIHTWFKIANTLDMGLIWAEARRMIAEDKVKQDKWLKTIKGTVTGSPWLCDFGEDEIVRGLVKDRQYRWLLESEIDWAALEVSLIKDSAIL